MAEPAFAEAWVVENAAAGWNARLALRFAREGSRTVLAARRHVGPLRVQKPLYPEGLEVCQVIVVHPPGGDLSGGQQQQVAIGRALAMGPKLVVLDEPTEGIQPSIIKDIERAIRRLAAEGEMAILLVEQYCDFARPLADRYVVLTRGEVIKAGKGADMDADGVRACLTV